MTKIIKKKNRASSFPNVVSYQEQQNGVIGVEENVNDIIVRGENSFKGWLCWAGIQSLYIDSNNDVYSASCRIHKLGNISDGFKMPEAPLLCTKSWCACAADINTTKIKSKQYTSLVRIAKSIL